MHIEDGHTGMRPWRDRCTLVKLALRRHKGPEQRAHVVKPEDVVALTWEAKCFKYRGHQRPAWSYAFACVWMLRAAEASEGQGETLETGSPDQDRVLTHPFLKDGPERKGSYKDPNMHVLGWQSWKMVCVGLSLRALAEHTVENGEAMLFKGVMTNNRSGVSKAQMVVDGKEMSVTRSQAIPPGEERSHALHKGGTGRGDNQFLGAMEIVGGAEIH